MIVIIIKKQDSTTDYLLIKKKGDTNFKLISVYYAHQYNHKRWVKTLMSHS